MFNVSLMFNIYLLTYFYLLYLFTAIKYSLKYMDYIKKIHNNFENYIVRFFNKSYDLFIFDTINNLLRLNLKYYINLIVVLQKKLYRYEHECI